MIEEFAQMLKAQRSALDALEQNEKDLMKVRDHLNKTIRDADDLDIKHLVLTIMVTNSAILASEICSNQNQLIMAKQAIIQQEVIIKKISKQLGPGGLDILGGLQE